MAQDAPVGDRPRNRKRLLRWLFVVFSAYIATEAGCLVHERRHPWTPERVDRFARERLLPGLPRAEIESAFDSVGFSHEFYERFWDVERSARLAGIAPSEFGGAVGAYVPDPNLGCFTGGHVTICCFLDRDGRLMKYRIEVERLYL
jgi:hypothetical protein